ncbi:MAG: thioredoxin family protein [Chloroflexi bacterium]|nr:thioredoxin family protein [Chloroflexota bacterium]
MIERLTILLIALALGGTLWALHRGWLRLRVRRLAVAALPASLQQLVQPGRPAILYFTTDGCVQCRLQQAPALERLAAATGIPVYQLDAVTQSDLTSFYGVMTVPTTVVLDPERRPKAINYGLASLQKLQEQVLSPQA